MSRLFLSLFVACLAAVCGTTRAYADNTLRLAPSSEWQIDRAQDICRVMRVFGEGDEQVFLIVEKYLPAERFFMVLAGEPVRHRSYDDEAVLRFGLYEEEREVSFFSGDAGGMPAMIFSSVSGIAAPTEEQQAASELGREALERGEPDYEELQRQSLVSDERYVNAEFVYVRSRRIGSVYLETGSLHPPFAALDECLNALLASWGIDVEAHQNLLRPVQPSSYVGDWITGRDYPRSEIFRGSQAVIHFRLSVDEQGNATDCHIQRSTEGDAFRNTVCGVLLRNASFEPALDAEGNPIASYYASSVVFYVPTQR